MAEEYPRGTLVNVQITVRRGSDHAADEPVLAAILGTAWRASRALPKPQPPPTTIEVVPRWRRLWQWTDEAGRHEVRNWDTPELAQRYAPFARLSVDQVLAHFTAQSPM